MPAHPNPALWRQRYRGKGFLYIHQPEVVFKARVNQTEFKYPLASVAFDNVTVGSYSAVKEGMTIQFGTTEGAMDLGRQVVRLDANASTLFFGWSSRGKGRDGEVFLADNVYITVLDEYRVWPRIPRITKDGQVFKDFNLTLGTYGIYQPPVANGGPGTADFVNNNNLLIVPFDGTGSQAIAAGASISSYLWNVDDGTFQSGTTSSSSMPVVAFPPGFRWVHLTITDSNGKTHTCHIPVFAAEKTGSNAPITRFNWSLSRQPQGQTANFEIFQDLPESTYPNGMLVMFWKQERYGAYAGSLTGPSGRQHMKFIGWHQTDNNTVGATEINLERGLSLSCVDVGARLAALPGFPMVLDRESTPARWQQMANADINRFVHYILHWHSTALTLADFFTAPIGNQYPFPSLDSDGAVLYEQANGRANAASHRLTCNSRGQLAIKQDPFDYDLAERTNTVQITLEPADWSDRSYTHQHAPRVHWLDNAAIVTATQDASVLGVGGVQPVFAIAPGRAPGHGQASANGSYQLVRSSLDNEIRTGHRYARANSQYNYLNTKLSRGGDPGLEPAEMEWIRFNDRDKQADRRGRKFTLSERFIPLQVSIRGDNDAATDDIEFTAEHEVIGTPGQAYIPDYPDWGSYTPGYDLWPILDWGTSFFDQEPVEEVADQLGLDLGLMAFAMTATSSNKVARTFSLLYEEVLWQDITGPITGQITDIAAALDGSTLPARVVSYTGTTCNIWYTSDALAETVTWSLEHSFTLTGTGFAGALRIAMSPVADLAIVTWLCTDGIREVRYWNGVWGTAALIGGSFTTGDISGLSLGLAIDGATILSGGLSANNTFRIYMASNNGTFAQIGSTTYGNVPTAIAVNGDGDLYFSTWGTNYTDTAYNDTFDNVMFLCGAGSTAYCFIDSYTIIENSPSPNGQVTQVGIPAAYEKRWDFLADSEPVDDIRWRLTFVHDSDANLPGPYTYSVSYETTVTYKDANGDEQILTDSGTLEYSGSNPTYTSTFYGTHWLHTVYLDVMENIDVEGLQIVSLHCRAEWVGIDSSQIWPSGVNYIQIALTNTANDERLWWTIREYDDNAIYRIRDYATSPLFGNVSPDGGWSASHHYGLAPDQIEPDEVAMVGVREAISRRIFTSANEGAAWSEHYDGRYLWLKQAGAIYLAGGDTRLVMSVTGVNDLISRIGDFAESVGDPDTFLNLIVLFAEG